MAITKLCSIPDCGKPLEAHGWCATHYARWRRNGAPITVKPDLNQYLKDVVIPYRGDACLPWPYGRNHQGYGKIGYNKRTFSVHRLVCTAVHGNPPTPKHSAAHSCGKGHEGCVNPLHLSWKTPVENMADRPIHGTLVQGERHVLAKLTDENVRRIRSMCSSHTLRELAAIFGVGQTTIWLIKAGKSWRHVS